MRAQSVALIVSSPPYADSRKNVYGGVHPDDMLYGDSKSKRDSLNFV